MNEWNNPNPEQMDEPLDTAAMDADWEENDPSPDAIEIDIPVDTTPIPAPITPAPLSTLPSVPAMPQLERVHTTSAEQKRAGEMREFLETYPRVLPRDIPQQVWEKVRAGYPLTTAYALHRNSVLEAELAAEKQNQINFRNSIGSMFSMGESTRDEYAEGWDD